MQVIAEMRGIEGIECMPDDNFRVSIPVDQLLGEINLKLEHMSMRLTSLENGRIIDQTEANAKAAAIKSQKWMIGVLASLSSGLGVYVLTKVFTGGHG